MYQAAGLTEAPPIRGEMEQEVHVQK
jgi:hypothetical protein